MKSLELTDEKTYSQYKNKYKPGEIVLFKGEDENSMRYIALVLNENQWKVIDEGY